MKAFHVWAPLPKKVMMQVGRTRRAMKAGEGGWWKVGVSSAAAGSNYGFILDGKGPFPDPRSAWQPQGVHGFSRVLDHGAFTWSDTDWRAPPLSSAIIYELHVGTFTPRGTFEAAIDKLDYLAGLGVTHLELMPVNEFPGDRGWGYDSVGLFAPHHAYGGPQGLKRLVAACHARRLAVILDVVYNHFGPVGCYLGSFAPYFTKRYSTPWGPALNFDGPSSDEVRRFFCDNARMWLRDFHVDGLRLDAVHAILDTSAQPFLGQLVTEVKFLEAHLGRPLVLIAESDLNDPRLLWSHEHGGAGMDAQWNDDFHHALHAVLTGEHNGYYADYGALSHLAKALRQAHVYDGCYSPHRGRRHGRPTTGLGGHRFLAYLQNHDQIGNRAQGERASHLMSTNRLKIGAALVLTSPFVPMLFQGEEWGASTPFYYFADHADPALAQAVCEGRRQEFAAFGWPPEKVPDPQARDTFERSKLNWSELSRQPYCELLDWHRRLIGLRRAEPALTDGRLDRVRVRFDEQARWLVVERDRISIACNFAARTQQVPLREGKHQVLLRAGPGVDLARAGVTLGADAVAILKMDDEVFQADS